MEVGQLRFKFSLLLSQPYPPPCITHLSSQWLLFLPHILEALQCIQTHTHASLTQQARAVRYRTSMIHVNISAITYQRQTQENNNTTQTGLISTCALQTRIAAPPPNVANTTNCYTEHCTTGLCQHPLSHARFFSLL